MVVIYWRSTKNKKNSHVTTIKHVAVAVVEGVRGTEDALTVCEVEVGVVIEMAGGDPILEYSSQAHLYAHPSPNQN